VQRIITRRPPARPKAIGAGDACCRSLNPFRRSHIFAVGAAWWLFQIKLRPEMTAHCLLPFHGEDAQQNHAELVLPTNRFLGEVWVNERASGFNVR
jgi:hypothetical protein